MIELKMRRKTLGITIYVMMVVAAIVLSGAGFDVSRYSILLQSFLIVAGGLLSLSSATKYPFSGTQNRVLIILFFCSILIVFTSGTELIRSAYKMILFIIFIGVAKYARRNNIDLLKILFEVFSLVVVLSFICYFLVHYFGFEAYTYPVTTHINGFLGIYYYNKYPVHELFGNPFFRFGGFFWEPGLNGCYSSLALLYCLFFRKGKDQIFWAMFYLLVNLFTLSVTAIAVSVLIIVFYIWKNPRVIFEQRDALGVFFFGAAAIITFILFLRKSQDAPGVAFNGIEYNSMKVRWLDMTVGIRLFFKNLPFGTGYNNMKPFEKIFKGIVGYERDGSNGLVNWIYQTGIPGLVYLFMPFLMLYKKRHKLRCNYLEDDNSKTLLFILVIVVVVIVNMSEPITVLPIMGLIMGYLYDRAIYLNSESLLKNNRDFI